MLRMGREYAVNRLRQEAILRLLTIAQPTRNQSLLQQPTHEIKQLKFTSYELLDVLVLEEGIRLLAPALYIQCCSMTAASLLDPLNPLSWETRARIILGKEKFVSEVKQLCNFALTYCKDTKSGCGPRRRRQVASWLCSAESTIYLFIFVQKGTFWESSSCEACAVSFSSAWDRKAEEIWNRVPQMFDLPSWSDLTKEYNEYNK